jgi:hypothetical protein
MLTIILGNACVHLLHMSPKESSSHARPTASFSKRPLELTNAATPTIPADLFQPGDRAKVLIDKRQQLQQAVFWGIPLLLAMTGFLPHHRNRSLPPPLDALSSRPRVRHLIVTAASISPATGGVMLDPTGPMGS